MAKTSRPALKVLAFNCSLKSSKAKEKSSTETLLQQLLKELEQHGGKGAVVRAVDHNIKPGVTSDEGEGDDWPALRQLPTSSSSRRRYGSASHRVSPSA